MMKVIGFVLVLYNAEGGPIVTYPYMPKDETVLSTQEECERAQTEVNTTSGTRVRTACLPILRKEPK